MKDVSKNPEISVQEAEEHYQSSKENYCNGAGESQVVAPDGTVLARASLDKEEVVFADIQPALADDKGDEDEIGAHAAASDVPTTTIR